MSFYSRRSIFGLGVLLFILFSAIAGLKLLSNSHDIRKKAAVIDRQPASTKLNREIIPGEIIVKLKPSANFVIKKEKKDLGLDFDKKSIPYTDLDLSKSTPILKIISSRSQIKTVEKIFKGAQDAETELITVKRRYQKEIASGERKINEKQLLKLDFSRLYKIVFVDRNISLINLLLELRNQQDIEYAGLNYVYKIQLLPNDPFYLDRYPENTAFRDPGWNPAYDYQWNLKQINLEKAWELTTGSDNIKVAVIDTGVDCNHFELTAKCLPGYDFVNNDNNPADDYGHGTHVAGIIAATANNNQGIAGIMWKGKILPIKALDNYGRGQSDQLANAIRYAVDNKTNIINMSWGGFGYDQLIADAVSYAYNQSVVLVAAAGNDNIDVADFSPANLTCASADNPDIDCVIGVSAVTQDPYNIKANYSNWGIYVDISAPGGDNSSNILSLKSAVLNSSLNSNIVSTEYLRLSGTSMAAPHVSGLAALLLSKNPALTAEQVRNIIINGADDIGVPGFDTLFGYGRINAEKTLLNMDISIPAVAKISFPLRYFITGDKFDVMGSSYGKNFVNYQLEYATTYNATNWSSLGVSLENSGNTAVYNSKLASVNLNLLTDGIYYLRLTTKISDGKNAFTILPIQLDKSVRHNFPLPYSARIPVFADLKNDGKKEIILKNYSDSNLHVIQPDGKELFGWPKSMKNMFMTDLPVITDLDRDYPGNEIFTTVSPNAEKIFILGYHADATEMANWTQVSWQNKDSLAYVLTTFSSGFINNLANIIYPESSAHYYIYGTKIHVFDKNANELSGWPVSVNDNAIRVHPIIVDLNKDGHSDIVTNYYDTNANTNTLRYYSSGGALLREIPIAEKITNIAAADLDIDSFPEIIVQSNSYPAKPRKVYVFDHLGNIKSAGWPVILEDVTYPGTAFSSLSLGDYNNDGYPEMMVYVDFDYYIVDRNAELTKITKSFSGGPYDVTGYGNNMANIKLIDGSHLWAESAGANGVNLYQYDPIANTATSYPGFPKNFGYSQNSDIFVNYPSLVDLDNDKKAELIVTIQYGATEAFGLNYLYVFNLDRTVKTFDWPQFLHDERHTNFLARATLVGDLDGDGDIDIFDYNIILRYFGCSASSCIDNWQVADIDGNGAVNIFDYNLLLQNFGRHL